MQQVTLIGYWRNDENPEWPDPHEFVDEAWDPEERSLVGLYLQSGTVPWAAMGFSPCRICGKPNGSLEFTDGVYIWPEGLSHYVEDHSVRLPRQVIEHVLARVDAFDDRSIVDDRWWRTVRSDQS